MLSHHQQLHPSIVLLVVFAWLEVVRPPCKVLWRCATTTDGEQCVTICGIQMRLLSYVDN